MRRVPNLAHNSGPLPSLSRCRYLLFDIEICYLLPYVMCHANVQMFWTMNLFLSLLVVGFVYEWGVGALEWRN